MNSQIKVLVADDDPQMQLAVKACLMRQGYDVTAVGDGKAALDLLEERPFDLVISDQRMPVMTGVEFLEKSIVSHPNTSRILLTGYTDIESVIDAVNLGQIFRYLTKPWDPLDLINTVTQAANKYSLKIELREKNQKLEAALDELKNLDRVKNQFMILINHELKTPLTTILSFAALLKETELSEEQNLFTDRIQRSSDKLKSIVDDVLLIVKGEVGLIPSKLLKVNAETFVSALPAEVQQSLRAKNQTLKMNSRVESLEVDAHLTQMAFTRALHNATKFGLPDSEICVTCYNDKKHRGIISIENKGPQISEELIDNIMKPFQLDENVMNHSVGMGLGLTICNTLLKAQNGELRLQNNPAGVSVFFNFRL